MERIRRWLHDYLGWGYPGDRWGFDGCSMTAKCRMCDKGLLLDSQGNWFHSWNEED